MTNLLIKTLLILKYRDKLFITFITLLQAHENVLVTTFYSFYHHRMQF